VLGRLITGFWPGSGKLLEPAFFAFAVPEPPGCRNAVISPAPAGYHPDLGEFILPYDEVRRTTSPDQVISNSSTARTRSRQTWAGGIATRWSSPIPYRDRSVRYAIDQNAGAEQVIALSGGGSGDRAHR